MFERFVSFLDQLSGKAAPVQESINPMQLAVTALMFSVMDADGVRHEAEIQMLQDLVSQRFDLEGGHLMELINKAEAAEAESVGLYQFTSVVKRLEEHERVHLVELMWDVVFADGELHEMEDHVLWHIADLIAVSQRDRVELRRKAAARKPQARPLDS
jgi:uncharacterized tellurite resistance protein B-like protein